MKHSKGYHEHMAPFIKTGIPAIIAKAKQEYRKEYKRNWKRERKVVMKTVSVLFKNDEYKVLQTEAKFHNLKVASFVKKGVQAYTDKTYIIPSEEVVSKIHMLLRMMLIHVEDMKESDKPIDTYLLALLKLEHDIRIYVNAPPELFQYVKIHVAKNENHKTQLLEFIKSL